MTGGAVRLAVTGTGGKARLKSVDAGSGTAPETHRFDERARTRAELARVYAGILGVEVLASDILEWIAVLQRPDMPVAPQAIAYALENAGLLTAVETVSRATDDLWPALAQMTSGQFLLVMGQSRGDLVIFDTTCPDNRAHVPVALRKRYSGRDANRPEHSGFWQ